MLHILPMVGIFNYTDVHFHVLQNKVMDMSFCSDKTLIVSMSDSSRNAMNWAWQKAILVVNGVNLLQNTGQ